MIKFINIFLNLLITQQFYLTVAGLDLAVFSRSQAKAETSFSSYTNTPNTNPKCPSQLHLHFCLHLRKFHPEVSFPPDYLT